MMQIATRSQLHILLLEDAPTDAELIERELRKTGLNFILMRVESREAFARALENFLPDIVLSDYNLPGFSGLSALEMVKRDYPEIPVIMVTGALSDQEAVNLLQAGANDYALKDRLARLAPAVQHALLVKEDNKARKFAEAQLLERELQYRTLADSGQALIWASGTDKLCNYFNKVWLEFTGRSLEQEQGNGWTEGIHPDDLPHCVDVYVSAFERREKFSMDYRLRHHDGEYRWIQDDGCPRYDSNGVFVGYIGYCLDISERKHAEEALSRYAHDMGERIKEISCLRDITALSLKKNRSLESILNSCARRIPEGWLDPSSICARIRLENQTFETPGFKETEWKLAAAIPLAENRPAVVEVFYMGDVSEVAQNPFLDEERELIGSIAVQLGLSLERRWAEEKLKLQHESLRDSEERLRTIIENSMDAVVQIDSRGVITGWSSQAEEVLGWTKDEAIGREIHETIIPPMHREAHVRGMEHFKRTGEGPILNKRIEIVGLHRKGHEFPIELAVAPIKTQSEYEFSAFIRDITKRKEFESEILRSNIELEKFNSAISSDLLVARDVMNYIMRSDGLRDRQIRHFQRPTQQFSGDIIAAGRDNKGDLRVMLADVTGHGLQAALFLLPIFRVFRAMVKKGFTTSDIVTEINQTMRGIAETGRFIAAAVAHITRDGSSIEIWNGGIPTAFYVPKNGELYKFRSRHLPLGVVDADAFEAATEIFHAQPGALLLCSDGLTEAENASGEQFGEARFEVILRTSPPDRLFDNILSALEIHLGECLAHDDLSLMLAQCGD